MDDGLFWGGSEPTPTVTEQQPLYADTLENNLGQSGPIAQGQSNRSIAYCNRKPRPTLSNPTWSATQRLLQASDVDSIIESNPEMNDNQIAGLIYAEITGRVQNTTQNNQGSRSQDQGAQGEAGRAERTGQPAESRIDQETGQQEQQLNPEVTDEEAGQPATESNDGQGDQPTSGGVVQPGRAGADTVGAEDRGTTDPAIEQGATEPLTLDQEQDGTTPQSIDPRANKLLWEAAQSPLTEPGTQSRFAGNPESMSGQGTANAMQESSEEKE